MAVVDGGGNGGVDVGQIISLLLITLPVGSPEVKPMSHPQEKPGSPLVGLCFGERGDRVVTCLYG